MALCPTSGRRSCCVAGRAYLDAWPSAHDVAHLIAYLRQQEGERWALCFENSYLFIVALLATLYAGKTPVIPGHCRVSLLNEQHLLFDGVLSDKAMDWQGTLRVVAPP